MRHTTRSRLGLDTTSSNIQNHHDLVGGGLNDYSCGGSAAMDVWIKRPEVIKALHVRAGTCA